jgi:hypothetical protein
MSDHRDDYRNEARLTPGQIALREEVRGFRADRYRAQCVSRLGMFGTCRRWFDDQCDCAKCAEQEGRNAAK